MIIALELLDKSEKPMLEKYGNILSTWMNNEMHEGFQQAIKVHLTDGNWRLVD
jgi:isopentenyl-diphosphate delta-isomerase